MALLVPAAGGAQETERPVDSFVERIQVTAVEIMVDVRGPGGARVLGLGPDDFEVLEDGVAMEVIAVDEPTPAALGASGKGDAAIESPTWRTLVYFDLVLTQKRSVRRAAEVLLGRVDELVAMGPVELVVADPAPEIVLPFTRDGKRLRQELARVATLPANHQLASIRRDFLHMLDMRLHGAEPGPAETAAVFNQIRTAVNKESLLLNRRLITFGQWIGAYGHVPASAAILVTDGFDLAPADFYLSATSLPGAEAELSLELDRFRVDPLAEALAREIAARGWTSVLLALGGISELSTADASLSYRDRFRSIAELSNLSAGPESGSPASILLHPLEPLDMVAEKTGGEVMTTRKTANQALARIGERLRLTYLAPRSRDGAVHRVAVSCRQNGVTVRTPEWVRSPTREQIAAGRARRLLVYSAERGDARLDTATGDGSGEMPVRLTVERRGSGAEKGTSRAAIEIFFDLNQLRPVLPDPTVPMIFTFGIEVPAAPPLAYEVSQEVTLPVEETHRWPEFLYTVVLEVPRNARRLSVVVEEPASGVWGGGTRTLGP